MCWDLFNLKVGWLVSMPIPLVPQGIDLSSWSRLKDTVIADMLVAGRAHSEMETPCLVGLLLGRVQGPVIHTCW